MCHKPSGKDYVKDYGKWTSGIFTGSYNTYLEHTLVEVVGNHPGVGLEEVQYACALVRP